MVGETPSHIPPNSTSQEVAPAAIDLTNTEVTAVTELSPEEKLAQAQARERELAQLVMQSSVEIETVKAENESLKAENEGHLRVIKYLQERLMTDPLTNIPNRESFFQELEKRESQGLPFAVANIDLDKFKAINDHYGHSYGDKALQSAADLIVKALIDTQIRADDFVARLSGDEFSIILDMRPRRNSDLTPEERAEAAGKKIVEYIDNYALYTMFNRFGFKASYGVAVHEPGTDIEETMRLADERMYENKRQHQAAAESQDT